MLSVLTEEVVEEGDLEITSSKIEFSRRFWEVGFVKDNVESAHDLAAELAQAAAELGTVGKELRSMRRHGQSRRPPLVSSSSLLEVCTEDYPCHGAV